MYILNFLTDVFKLIIVVSFATIFISVTSYLLYLSRYFSYKIFYEYFKVTPSGFLKIEIVSLAFILWFLITASISFLQVKDSLFYFLGVTIVVIFLPVSYTHLTLPTKA